MRMELRHAIRLLLSQPVFAAAVVLTLGLGIGASTAVYSVVDAVLLKPLPYPDADRIVALTIRGRDQGSDGVTGGVIDAVRKLPSFEAAAAILHTEQSLVAADRLSVVNGARVTSEFFDVFKATPLAGRTLASAPNSVDEIVLGEQLWRQHFAADPQVVGRAIRLDDRIYTVVGVMPASFEHPDRADFWLSYQVSGEQRAAIGPGPFLAVARVSSAGLIAARAEAEALSAALNLTMGRERASFALMPFVETMNLYRRTFIYALTAVGFVLLIACANAGHVVLARTLGRAQELAVRTAIGATRTQIVRQLLVESSVLAAASGAAGLALAWLLMRAMPSIAMSDMPRLTGVTLDARVLAFAVAVSSASVLFIGLCPARLSSSSTHHLQASRGTSSKTARRTAAFIVTGEIALTLMLILCGGLATVTLLRRLTVDVGFDPQSLSLVALRPSLTTYTGSARGEYFDRVTEAVRNAPGIEAVAGTSHLPLDLILAANAAVSDDTAGASRPQTIGAGARMVAPGTFAALRVPVLKGREFEAGDRSGGPLVAVVNAALAARLWRDADPVGKVVRAPAFTVLGFESYRVAGVVGNLRGSLRREPGPELYVSALQRPPRTMHLMIRSRLGLAGVDSIVREAIGTIDPEQPAAGAVPMGTLFRQATEFNRFSALWLTSFASFALVLAVGGILATVMRAVVTRTRELGIRAAIGATPAQQVRLVMRDLLLPVAIGSGLGLAGTYNLSAATTRYMAIDRIETTVSLMAVVVVVFVVGLSAWIPARRAARIDPVRALQAE